MVYNGFMDPISAEYLTATRRKLHALAELSGKEYKTSAFITEELKSFGFKPKAIGTGVFCDVGKGPRLALRADIDALPIKENVEFTGVDFAADGEVMHACGHDGHTANLLNVARIVGSKSDVPLRFIFQFGEEGIGGSEAMIDGGVLDGVEEIYALHMCPELDEGKVGYCYGAMFAGCVEFDVEFKGVASHCATPEKGADAVRASIHAANKAFDAAKAHNLLINLGKIHGGAARNIVADKCVSEYTLRFYDTAKSEAVVMAVERALIEADDVFGTEHDLITSAVYPPLINNALCVDKIRSIMGDRAVAVEPRNTAEDFSNYLNKVRGAIVWLGTKKDGKYSVPLHSDKFSFDESALLTGTELFLKLIEAHAEAQGRKYGR